MSRPSTIFDRTFRAPDDSFPSVAQHAAILQRVAAGPDKIVNPMLTSAFVYTCVKTAPDRACQPDMASLDEGLIVELKTSPEFATKSRFDLKREWLTALYAKGIPVGEPHDFRQAYIPWDRLPAFINADGTLWSSLRDDLIQLDTEAYKVLYETTFSLDPREDYSYRSSQHNSIGSQKDAAQRGFYRTHASRRLEADRDGRHQPDDRDNDGRHARSGRLRRHRFEDF